MRHLRKILILLAVLSCLTISAYAYAPEVSEGQANIVKRARQLTELEWTPLQDVYQWSYEGVFKAGMTFTGAPYGQPVSNGGYIGWNVSLDRFMDYINDNTSNFYTTYSWYNQIAPYYSADCSSFVSYAWQTDQRLTTATLPDYAQRVEAQSIDAIEVGDVLNNMSTHAVLITAVDLNSEGRVVGVEIMEETPVLAAVTGYGTLGSRSMDTFNTRFFGQNYVLFRRPDRDSVVYTHSCAVPLDGDYCPNCAERAPFASTGVTADGKRLVLSHRDAGAEIHYTTDGSVPSADSPLYTGPLDFSETAVVRAIALTGHFSNQRVLTYRVAVESAAAPAGTITEGTHDGGLVSAGSALTLTSATPGAKIHYTTDGSVPSADSPLYTAPIRLTQDVTVRAIALQDGYAMSDVSSFPFQVAELYTVTVSASGGGTVSPLGKTELFAGRSLTLQIQPDNGYAVDSITVDGGSVAAASSYTLENISANHTVSVAFRDNTPLPFTDVADSAWYRPAVVYAYRNGLYNGTSATTFSPENHMTRAMYVTVLSRLAGVPEKTEGEFGLVAASEVRLRSAPSISSDTLDYLDRYEIVSVVDQSGDWYQVVAGNATGWVRGDLLLVYDGRITDLPEGKYYTNAVKWASLTGVASGSGGLFRGGDDILRQDMAVMLYRYAALRGISLSAAGSDSFTDDGTIASYAREAVYALRNAGIISGMGDGSFVPGGTATRAQVAQIFRNFAART